MNDDAFSKYLTSRYQDQIQWYDKRAARYQRVYCWMQWILIVLAAVTPVLIELKPEPIAGDWGRWATLTASLVAILTAALKTFKYQENWVNYRTTCETLRKEYFFYEAGVGSYIGTKDRKAVFVERVESLISRENTVWLNHQSEDQNSSTN